MTNYLITEQDFKNLVDWRQMIQNSNCKVSPHNGNSSGTSGHESCGSCPGNYYNGGCCNYGGQHVLADEVARINSNFQGIDVLGEDHEKLKLSADSTRDQFEDHKNRLLGNFQKVRDNCTNANNTFVYGSCVGIHGTETKFIKEAERRFKDFVQGIDRYIQQIKNLTWHEVEEFQQKLKQIKDLKEENNKLLQEYKDPNTSPGRKAQIMATIDKNKKNINNLTQQLSKNPARNLFDPQTSNILRDAKYNLFHGNGNPFDKLGKSKGPGDWKSGISNRGGNKNNSPGNNKGEAFISPENSKILKQIGAGVAIIASLGIVYAIFKNKLRNN